MCKMRTFKISLGDVRKYEIDLLHDAWEENKNDLINIITELQAEVHENGNKIIDFKKHIIHSESVFSRVPERYRTLLKSERFTTLLRSLNLICTSAEMNYKYILCVGFFMKLHGSKCINTRTVDCANS